MPNVLLDTTILSNNTRHHGIGRYVIELARGIHLRAAAHDLRIRYLANITPTGRATIVDDPDEAIALQLRRREVGFDRWAHSLRLGVARAVRRADVALVHMPYSFVTPLFPLGAKRIVTCHDLIPLRFHEQYLSWRSGYKWGRRLLDKRRLATADHVLTISAEVKRDIVELLDVDEAKITAVLHGLDHAEWTSEPDPEDAARIRALGIVGPFFVYVGQADWRKNHAGMFAGLARAARDVPGVQLVWAGGLHPKQLARIHADRRRTGARVTLTGFVDDATLHALYRHATGTIFVSRAEGFGYPVIEAMALGCPVITSAQSSMKEIAGDAALLVDPEDHSAIANAIVALATRPELRADLRRRGLAHAATFTLERQADETLAVYRRVASESG